MTLQLRPYQQNLPRYFADWFDAVFPYCYGTGEEKILPAVIQFFYAVKDGNQYDYRDIEAACGDIVGWLLINEFCSVGIIEYGTSPRFGWLTHRGLRLKELFDIVKLTELEEWLGATECGDPRCGFNYCNCGGIMEAGCKRNPFFTDRPETPNATA